MTREEKEREKK